MTLEERVSALEAKVRVLESHRFPDGWRYYPPLNDTRNVGSSEPVNGGLDAVMNTGNVPRETR